MANPTHLQMFGNEIAVLFSDGSKQLAYPTGSDLWIIGGPGTPSPDHELPESFIVTDCENQSVTLENYQLQWASKIIQIAATVPGVGEHGTIIALMTVMVESVFKMYANSTIPASLNYPHDAVGSDHDSLGLFQQRLMYWGTVPDLMDVEYNTLAFLGGPTGPNDGSPAGLLDIAGWESMGYGEAAQAVQGSDFPDRYECWKAGMIELYNMITNTAPPSPEGDYIQPFGWGTVSSEYGPRTLGVGSFHEGTDFGGGAVGGVGTPIKASGNGIVDLSEWHNGWGYWVIIDHGILGPGPYEGKRHKSLYAHMTGAPLSVGSAVVAGVTVVGGVGNTGSYSQGAHLHWETHIMDAGSGIVWNTNNNGGYRTAVNPRDFIAGYGA